MARLGWPSQGRKQGEQTLSPLQYRQQLRLQHARRLLHREGLTALQAATRVGYESASQFSREYHRLFGMPPGKDNGPNLR